MDLGKSLKEVFFVLFCFLMCAVSYNKYAIDLKF